MSSLVKSGGGLGLLDEKQMYSENMQKKIYRNGIWKRYIENIYGNDI